MTPTATPPVIAGLAARLTDSQDREAYAALVSYINELPPGDEFRQLMEILGLVSLLGQQLPVALGDAMTELRELSDAANDDRAGIEARLANLPQEIAEGVDIGKIAKQMAEAFRQQIAETGLQNTAAVLRASTAELVGISGQLSTALKPVGTVVATISGEIGRLAAANAQFRAEQASDSWLLQVLYTVVLFLVGAGCGLVYEKTQTSDVINSMHTEIQRIQMPVAKPR